MRCKVGDLCWIIRDDFPENIGKVVLVLGRPMPGHRYGPLEFDEWELEALNPLRGWTNTAKTISVLDMCRCVAKDSHLLPFGNKSNKSSITKYIERDVPKVETV